MKKILNSIFSRILLSIIIVSVGLLYYHTKVVNGYKDDLITIRKQEIVRLVTNALATVSFEIEDYERGIISKETAYNRVKEKISRLIYEDFSIQNYFFMIDYRGNIVVNPFRKSIEDDPSSQLSKENIKLVKEMIMKAREGGGFIEYNYKPPAGVNPEKKISYITGINSLGVLFGTGFYISDIDKFIDQAHSEEHRLLIISIGLTFILFLLTIYPVHNSIRDLNNFISTVSFEKSTIDDLFKYKKISLIEIQDIKNKFIDFYKRYLKARNELDRIREEIKIADKRLNDALDITIDSVYEYDVNKKEYIFISDRFYHMLGYNKDEFDLKSASSLIHPDDYNYVIDKLDIVFKNPPRNDKYELRYRMKNAQGVYRWIQTVAKITQKNPDGTASRVVGTRTDVTDKVRIEKELKDSESRYTNLISNLPVGIFRTTPMGAIIDANKALIEMLEYEDIDDLKSSEPRNLIYKNPNDRSEFIQTIEKYSEIKGYETIWVKKDGSYVNVRENARAVRDRNGTILYYDGAVEDITESKAAQTALKNTEYALLSFKELTPLAIIEFDTKLNIIDWNKGAEKTFGFEKEEILGKSAFETIIPYHLKDEVLRTIKSLGKDRKTIKKINENLTKSGKIIICEWHNALITDRTGENWRYMTAALDITTLIKQEEALTQYAERLESLRDIEQGILSEKDPESITSKLLTNLHSLIGFNLGNVVSINKEENKNERITVFSDYGTSINKGSVSYQFFDDSIFNNKRFLLYRDLTQLPSLYDHEEVAKLIHENLKSIAIIPLRFKNETIGIMNLFSKVRNFFTETDLEIASEAADSLAVALHEAKLYNQAKKDAETRQILLNEINHRVKNNLMAILGLFAAEKKFTKKEHQEIYNKIMKDMSGRIQGMSTVHGLLTQTGWRPLKLETLISTVVKNLVKFSSTSNRICDVIVSNSSIEVSSKNAHNLALLFNELTTNSLKYGKGDSNLKIKVDIVEKDDKVTITYRDNGIGYPEVILNDPNGGSVGLYLITQIVKGELAGEISFKNDNGAVAEITY